MQEPVHTFCIDLPHPPPARWKCEGCRQGGAALLAFAAELPSAPRPIPLAAAAAPGSRTATSARRKPPSSTQGTIRQFFHAEASSKGDDASETTEKGSGAPTAPLLPNNKLATDVEEGAKNLPGISTATLIAAGKENTDNIDVGTSDFGVGDKARTSKRSTDNNEIGSKVSRVRQANTRAASVHEEEPPEKKRTKKKKVLKEKGKSQTACVVPDELL